MDIDGTPYTRGLAALFLGSALALAACSGDFHANRGFDDMECDASGCFFCSRGDCEEYRCDATHQCPMGRVCSVDQHCLLNGDGGVSGACNSHDDCASDEICTLDGNCVASPGGGPGKGDVDATDGDTGDGDTSLPDHPDPTCRDNGDCGSDGTCINGGCFFPCAADDRCPPGQACGDDDLCRDAPPENACTFHGECGTDAACVEGTCYQRCEENLDCIAHTRCDTGLCVADTTPAIQCSGPGSCGDGLSCVDGKCVAACSDGSCEVGYSCDLGYCVKDVSCFDSSDCGGADCIDGACAK